MHDSRDEMTGRLVVTAPDTETQRFCPGCDEYRDFACFYADKRTKSGLTRRCREHHSHSSYQSRIKNGRVSRNQGRRKPTTRERKTRHLRWAFGMTHEEFDALLESQGGRCAICRRDEELHVDHCHETGRVRGLLCRGCNVSLGFLREDVDTMRAMIAYVEGAPLPEVGQLDV